MRRNIFKSVFLLVTFLSCNVCADVLAEAYYNYTPTTYTTSDSYPRIAQIEKALFRRSYESEEIDKRLDRLELKLFKKTYKNLYLAQRVDNVISSISPSMLSQIPGAELSKLEMRLFKRTYSNEDAEYRIIRLEKEMLGAMQYGDLSNRFETVKAASMHYNSYPQAAYGTYDTDTSDTTSGKSTFKNVLGGLAGAFFGGTVTGYTPPVYDNFSGYSSGYNGYDPYLQTSYPGGYEYNNAYRNNNNYYNSVRNYGMGSGIRILD